MVFVKHVKSYIGCEYTTGLVKVARKGNMLKNLVAHKIELASEESGC